MNYEVIDSWIKVKDKDSFIMAKEIIRKEGLFIGGSSGTVLKGVFQYLKKNNLEKNKNLKVLVIFPDSSTNYLSTFIRDEWMVGMGYLPSTILENKKHIFYGFKLK